MGPKKTTTKKTNKTLSSFVSKDKKSDEPLAPSSKVLSTKKTINNLNAFLNREESISPPTVPKKYSLHYHLKNTPIQMIKLQCPNFRQAISKFSKKFSVDSDFLGSLVERHFHGSLNSLWCDTYRPRNSKQTLNDTLCKKIEDWLKAFNFYRNTITDESNSFIDDYDENSETNPILLTKKKFGWKLKGLLLKGRACIGKTSIIQAISKELDYELLLCGNESNQVRYLREKNEATQSECVAVKPNKAQLVLHQTNTMITKFAVPKQQPKSQVQTRKIQLMHNVNHFQPEEEANRFNNELKKTIEGSKIPFFMTFVGDQVPENLQGYDQIDFEQVSTNDLAELFYLIYHIENCFPKLERQKLIDKDKVYSEVDQCFEGFDCNVLVKLSQFIRLVQIFDKNLVLLYTFTQFQCFDIDRAEEIKKRHLKNSRAENMLEEYFHQPMAFNFKRQIEKQVCEEKRQRLSCNRKDEKSSQQFHFDEEKYLIPEPQEKRQEKQSFQSNQQIKEGFEVLLKKAEELKPTLCTPQKSFDESVNLLNHTRDENDASKTMTNQTQEPKQSVIALKQRIKQLRICVLQDYKQSIKDDQLFIFNKFSNFQDEKFEEDMWQNIPMYFLSYFRKNHTEIRKSIVENIKRGYYERNQIRTSLKASELPFIGLLLGSRTRIRRNKNSEDSFPLQRYLKKNEINYLNSFTDFVKPGSN